jgi:predicted thioredoxin/glutaredoxin
MTKIDKLSVTPLFAMNSMKEEFRKKFTADDIAVLYHRIHGCSKMENTLNRLIVPEILIDGRGFNADLVEGLTLEEIIQILGELVVENINASDQVESYPEPVLC